MASPTLEEIATRHQSHYERLKSHEVKKFDPFLKQMDRDIRLKLSAVDVTELSRAKMEAQIRQIGVLLDGSYDDYKKVWDASTIDASIYEAGFEQRSLSQVVDGVNFRLPSDSQITAAVFNTPLGSIGGASGGALLDTFFDDMSATEVKRIEGAIRLGYAEGQTTQQIITNIRGTKAAGFSDGMLAISKRNVETVTRTALQHASSQARGEVWQANKRVIEGREIVATLDQKTSTICFVGKNKVSSLSKIDKIFMREYVGDLVTITTSGGKEITGTPNHPILTANGWTPLTELNPFDQVIYSIDSSAGIVSKDDKVNTPPVFSELFNSASKLISSRISTKSSSAGDFHGDISTRDGDVNIVDVEAFLGDTYKTSRSKLVKNILLGFVKFASSFCSDCLIKLSFCARRIVNKTAKRYPVAINNLKYCGSTSACDRGYFFEARTRLIKLKYMVSLFFGDLVSLTPSEVLESGVAFKEACSGGRGGFILSSDSSGGHPTPMIGEYIIKKSIKNTGAFSCHVFNLQCSQGYYIIEGVLVKNCRSLDGQVFPLDSGPKVPFHMNCRSSEVVVLKDEFKELSAGGTRSTRNPETGKVGKTSASTTYYDFLKRQPASVQDSIIGPTRGKLLRNGGISSERFAELSIGKNFQPLDLKSMRKLDPVAFDKAGI